MLRPYRLSAFLLALAVPLAAQAPKKILTQADWDRWESITAPVISSNGKWIAYTITPRVGDAEFVVRATVGATEYRVPVGWTAKPNNNPGGLARANLTPPAAAQPVGRTRPSGTNGPFTADAKYVLVGVQSPRADVERAQAANKAANGGRGAATGRGAGTGGRGAAGAPAAAGGRGAAAPTVGPLDSIANKTALVIISLADGRQTVMPNVTSYRLPRFSGAWMTYVGGDSTGADSTGAGAAGAGAGAGGRGAGGGRGGAGGGRAGAGGRGGAGGGAATSLRRTLGSPVTLRNMATGVDEKIADVVSYVWDDSAKVMAYTVGSRTDSTKDGLYIRDMATGEVKTVMAGPGNYRGFAFDRDQKNFLFFSDRDQRTKGIAQGILYVGSVAGATATATLNPDALPPTMKATEAAAFTRAGNAVTFSLIPPAEDSIIADSLVGKANFDLWNYKDVLIQTEQKVSGGRGGNRNYQAIYYLDSKKLVKLATDTLRTVNLTDDGKYGVSSTTMPYDASKMWGDQGNDLYVINPATGERTMIAKKAKGNIALSVGGKYAIYYTDGNWFTYAFDTKKTTNLTAGMKGVHFEQETWSTPDPAPAWGVAGWTKGDASVLINDRFDVWELDPTGVKHPIVITDSVGRKQSLTFRLIDPEQDRTEDRAVDPSKPLYFSAFSEATKGSGFYSDKLGVKQLPEKLAWGDLKYGVLTKARDATMYFVTKSTFIDPPNLWVGANLSSLTKVSNINAFQKDYNWGTAELVTWTSGGGKPLQGILYKPENFDPKKKYPMISYFYEDLSDGLNGYISPNGSDVINPTHYVSNGYLVFEPDIYYDIGHPGMSAVKSIIPGVQSIMKRGYVDPKGLGLQGQSWGGYQTAFLITQTSMFSAAMAGAPVGDMISAYAGIRLGGGIARAVQYENGQSRIGKSIWDAQQLYIENSPIFWLPKITTPLFMMSNDQDDAVPHAQGIEMFVDMKRLGKEVYMIDYNNDVHNPASRVNQKDLAMRMQQFFDNKLKGAPAPGWMTDGIPFKDKGKDLYTVQKGGGN